MAHYRVQIGNFNELAKYYRKLGRDIEPAMRKGVFIGAQRSLGVFRKTAQLLGAWGRGGMPNYMGSFRASKHPLGAMIYNFAPYAGVIEWGRRAGFGVSKEGQLQLAQWVRRKLRVKNESEVRSLVFVIARAIKARGLQPRNVMKRALPYAMRLVNQEITKAISAAMGGLTP